MSDMNRKQEGLQPGDEKTVSAGKLREDGGSNDQQVRRGVEAGIVPDLGEWPPQTIVTLNKLAEFCGRDPVSIKRAVERGELPPPMDFFGKRCWTIRALRDHIDKLMEAAKRKREQEKQRLQKLNLG